MLNQERKVRLHDMHAMITFLSPGGGERDGVCGEEAARAPTG